MHLVSMSESSQSSERDEKYNIKQKQKIIIEG